MKIMEVEYAELENIGVQSRFDKFEDARGGLTVLAEGMEEYSLKTTQSKKGVFRGMHLQREPYSQEKIIALQTGCVREFILDINDPSKIYTWIFNSSMGWLKIPPNYYHGYYVLEDSSFIYMCVGQYSEAHEMQLNITSHIKKYLTKGLIMSDKDKNAKALNEL